MFTGIHGQQHIKFPKDFPATKKQTIHIQEMTWKASTVKSDHIIKGTELKN